MLQLLLDKLRRRLAWRLLPDLGREETKHRFRLIEHGLLAADPSSLQESQDQLVYIQQRLDIEHLEKPAPYNVDPDDYPTPCLRYQSLSAELIDHYTGQEVADDK